MTEWTHLGIVCEHLFLLLAAGSRCHEHRREGIRFKFGCGFDYRSVRYERSGEVQLMVPELMGNRELGVA